VHRHPDVKYALLRTLSEQHLWGIEDDCVTLLKRFLHFLEMVETVREQIRRAESKVMGGAGARGDVGCQ
jgi:hypothetical protein